MEDDKVFYELVDQVLVLHLVPLLRDGDKRRAKADGQVVRVHHVLVTEM